MKEIRNTTLRPLRVPLPQGGVLHLGPRHVGQVAASALDHPPLKKLLDAGEIELLGEGEPESRHPVKEERTQGSQTRRHAPAAGIVHPSGDR